MNSVAVIPVARAADPSELPILRLSIRIIVAGVSMSKIRHVWGVGFGAVVSTVGVLHRAVVWRCRSRNVGSVELLGHVALKAG
jgi:hypothetical protein